VTLYVEPVAYDQKGEPVLDSAVVEQDGLLGSRSQEITGLESQTKRGARDFGNEDIAFRKPLHIARKNLFRRHASVRVPSIVSEQVGGEDVVSH